MFARLSPRPYSLLRQSAILLLLVEVAHRDVAGADDTFRARMKFNLCPEYSIGGVTLEYGYRVGSQTSYQTLTGQNQSIDPGTKTGQVDIVLPATHGQTPLSVAAFCRNSHGRSLPSSEKILTYCDAERLKDSDADGLSDAQEDLNCNGFFDPADPSNLFNVDTDGDGVRDLVEAFAATDPANPGSSPRPFVFSPGPFDPENDGNSNAIAWRPAFGQWYIRDLGTAGNNVSFQWGLKGDVPFVYRYRNENLAPQVPGLRFADVGVIRRAGTDLQWYFHGKGLERSDGSTRTLITFGVYGDNIVSGPYEERGVTNPAVAHIFNGVWTFYILLRDGSVRSAFWGGNNDIPKPSDYDGDGLFDIAVFRPSNQTTYIIRSSDGGVMVHTFGTGTADTTVRGDFTADGKDDIGFWEPLTAVFTLLTSNNGFSDAGGANKNPAHYLEAQLGVYNAMLPLNWQMRAGRQWFSVVEHAVGMRYLKDPLNPAAAVEALQWGLSNDAMG